MEDLPFSKSAVDLLQDKQKRLHATTYDESTNTLAYTTHSPDFSVLLQHYQLIVQLNADGEPAGGI